MTSIETNSSKTYCLARFIEVNRMRKIQSKIPELTMYKGVESLTITSKKFRKMKSIRKTDDIALIFIVVRGNSY